MRVLILGSGGREHALAWRIGQDSGVTQVIAAPGNPGVTGAAPKVPAGITRVPVDINNEEAVLDLARAHAVDLVVIGPEAPLDAGVADALRAAGFPVIGPGRQGAQLECSKVFAKHFMAKHGIPTARFVVADRLDAALEAIAGPQFGFPVVVKADGLAAGKGVVVAANKAEAEAAVRACLEDGVFGAAGATVVIEECLTGPEVSFFALCDGQRALALGSAQDHKRAYDDDRGPNTGGMGAFAPSPLMTPALQSEVMSRIVAPVLAAMPDYIGFLYVSLMLTPDGPRVIEFNVRFGDPEAQALLPALDGDFTGVLAAAATGRLDQAPALSISTDKFVAVVMASAGYPGKVDTGRAITGLDEAARRGAIVFHAGTKIDGGRVVTNGGRVLAVVGRGPSYADAVARAYDGVAAIAYDGAEFRTDIGRKAL
jgi:phosphoribosylamine--glycine ligase